MLIVVKDAPRTAVSERCSTQRCRGFNRFPGSLMDLPRNRAARRGEKRKQKKFSIRPRRPSLAAYRFCSDFFSSKYYRIERVVPSRTLGERGVCSGCRHTQPCGGGHSAAAVATSRPGGCRSCPANLNSPGGRGGNGASESFGPRGSKNSSLAIKVEQRLYK